jgi:hypothetical protein
MIGDRSFTRSLAWIDAGWRILAALKRGSGGGWPDKSAAVGVGGGDCNKTIISAVARNPLLALLLISAMISMENAPSATESLKSAVRCDE